MGRAPTILVLGDESAAAAVRAAGYTVVGASEADPQRPPEAVLIDARGGLAPDAASQAEAFRARTGPGGTPVLALGSPDQGDTVGIGFDGILSDAAAPRQLAARLNAVLRMAVMRDEAALRVGTLLRFGAHLDMPLDPVDHRATVLMFGKPGPLVMGMTSLLETRGAEVVGAFSSFSAFDYLHMRAFDAVVVSGLDDMDSAFGFCAALRRNARLFHLPALLLVPPTFDRIDEAFGRGVTDLAHADLPLEPMVAQLLALAAEKRRRDSLHGAFKAARVPSAMDEGTGLYNRSFFAAHLGAQVERAHQTGRPLAVAVVAVADDESTSRLIRANALKRVLLQAGGMMARLVRAEDMAARLDHGIYAIALPSCGRDAALQAADRISAVMACTAFDIGDGSPPVTLRFEVAAAELGEEETAPRLLARALATFTTGAVA